MQSEKTSNFGSSKKNLSSSFLKSIRPKLKISAPNRASQNPILNEFNDTRNESIRSNDTIVAVFYFFLRKYKSRIALVRARAD